MKLLVGLGNPGSQYELTRHNIGFIVLDLFSEFHKIKLKEGKGDWYEGGNEEISLLKPQSYMNNSGVVIKDFIEKNNIDVKDILVIVDDFQLPLGTIRVREKGSDGGHNGLASIIYNLDTEEFPRMRIGIGRDEQILKDEYVNYVLEDFGKDEIETIKKLIPHYNKCIESFIHDGVYKTMNKFNKSFITEEEEKSDKKPKGNKDI